MSAEHDWSSDLRLRPVRVSGGWPTCMKCGVRWPSDKGYEDCPGEQPPITPTSTSERPATTTPNPSLKRRFGW